MKNNIYISYAALAGILLLSCNGNTKQSTTVPEVEPAKAVPITEPASCYAMIKNKDKVLLHITITNNKVNGDLIYSFFEKDKNTGTIQGNMKGDTLFAEYKFMSEGTESIREVVFLKNGDDFVEGYGDSEEKNGRMIFKNTSGLNFNNNLILKNVACEK